MSDSGDESNDSLEQDLRSKWEPSLRAAHPPAFTTTKNERGWCHCAPFHLRRTDDPIDCHRQIKSPRHIVRLDARIEQSRVSEMKVRQKLSEPRCNTLVGSDGNFT
jgi:hypothetical protein